MVEWWMWAGELRSPWRGLRGRRAIGGGVPTRAPGRGAGGGERRTVEIRQQGGATGARRGRGEADEQLNVGDGSVVRGCGSVGRAPGTSALRDRCVMCG